tara:strand:- start:205 stop:738 length:534 start_codon:yes stop_codon:yes gene_type:complete
MKRSARYERMKKLKGKELHRFVSGFVDGEGSFSISVARQPYRLLEKGWRWIINPLFQVYQHEDNLWFLEFLKDEVFKTGRIHRKSSPYHVFTFSIENRTTLYEKVVPFFRKYRLATKDDDFQKFALIIEKIYKKEHLKEKGFKEIINIAFTMNKHGKQRKFSKEYIFETLSEQFRNT